MAIGFLEPGSAHTQGLDAWRTVATGGTDSWSSDATIARNNSRSIKAAFVGTGARFTYLLQASPSAFSGGVGRMSIYVYISQLPASGNTVPLFGFGDTGGIGAISFLIGIKSDGKLQLYNTNGVAIIKSGTTAYTAGSWIRITPTWNIVNGSLWAISLYAGADPATSPTLEFAASNADGSLASFSPTDVVLGDVVAVGVWPAGTTNIYYSDLFADDGSLLSDPGDINVTDKIPVGESTNNFDTSIGANPSDRWENVDDRPLSASTGWQHAATSTVEESFTVQASGVGDKDLTGATIVGHGAWCYAKDGSAAGSQPALRGAAQVPAGNPTTGGTITIPATVAANDIVIVSVTSRDSTGLGSLAVTDNEGAGSYALFANSTDHKASLWWKRASANTNSKTLTVAGAVGSCSFVVKCFSGCVTSGDPFTDVVVETNASGNETHATFTPTNADSMVLATVHNIDNDNAVTSLSFATLGATTATEKTSNAGSDCGCIFGHVAQAGAAAATGSLTWAQTDGATYSITCALTSASPSIASDGSPQLIRNGTDVAVDLTSTAKYFHAYAVSASFPTGAFGMKSTGTAADTFLYECGALIAYTPAVGGGGGDRPSLIGGKLVGLGLRRKGLVS